MKPKVFISYAREDVNIAMKLYDDLKSAGVRPWMASKNILPGENWKRVIYHAIEQSEYMLLLLSSNSTSKRGFARKELRSALDMLDEFPEGKIFIIPVRLDDCEIFDERLQHIHWVDLFPSYSDGLNRILKGLSYEDKYSKKDVFIRYLYIFGRILITPFLLLYTFPENLKKITLNLINTIKNKPKAQNIYKISSQFFIRTGYLKVESLSDNVLFLHPREGQIAGMVFIFKEGESDKELLNITEKYTKNIKENPILFNSYIIAIAIASCWKCTVYYEWKACWSCKRSKNSTLKIFRI